MPKREESGDFLAKVSQAYGAVADAEIALPVVLGVSLSDRFLGEMGRLASAYPSDLPRPAPSGIEITRPFRERH